MPVGIVFVSSCVYLLFDCVPLFHRHSQCFSFGVLPSRYFDLVHHSFPFSRFDLNGLSPMRHRMRKSENHAPHGDGLVQEFHLFPCNGKSSIAYSGRNDNPFMVLVRPLDRGIQRFPATRYGNRRRWFRAVRAGGVPPTKPPFLQRLRPHGAPRNPRAMPLQWDGG